MNELPPEIIENIFIVGNVTIADVLSASVTCKHLRDVLSNSNPVWKSVYRRYWPNLAQHLHDDDINWLDELKYIQEIKSTVQDMLHIMASTYYSHADVGPSELVAWKEFMTSSRPIAYHIVVEYLMKLIWDYREIFTFKVVPLLTPGNYTMQYYCIKALQFLRHERLTAEYKEFLQLDERERTMERVATFVAQWCQPLRHVDFRLIQAKLDSLAYEARNVLLALNPNHPLFKVPEETLLEWRERNLEEHQFCPQRCQEVLTAVNVILYKRHAFTENHQDFYDPKNSYINYVLLRETGLPILMCIVYESITRRLGVNCEPVNVPSHFLLRYQRFGNDCGMCTVFYLNASNQGVLFPRGVCPYSANAANPNRQHRMMPRATSAAVFARMAANLENSYRESPTTANSSALMRTVFQLSVLIAPQNLNFILNLARCCMSLNMDMHFLVDIVKETTYDEEDSAANILHMLDEYHTQRGDFAEETPPRRRPTGSEQILYAIGMVMTHKVRHYIGVIIDWTPVCIASPAWQKSMNVDCLDRKANQPFYYVMANDGSSRYVAEENVVLSDDPGSLLCRAFALGRHFSHFYLNHFVPNKQKDDAYPDDRMVRRYTYQLF